MLWIAHTHIMLVWDSTPRIAFLSPEPASGKSRALEVSELLVPAPVEAVNVSAAYLFHKVGEQSSTILFDEIDTVFGPKAKENEEIRGLLNAGHRRGAVTGRCMVRGKEVVTVDYPAYCALALAGLGWLPDTILSRSVIVRMRRRKPSEKVTPFRRRTELEGGHKLRDRLDRWTRGIANRIDLDVVKMPEGVEDRNADVWEALLAIADMAGGEWQKRAREAAKELIKEASDAEPSLGIRLLSDTRTVFGNAKQQITTENMLKALHGLPESPWNDLKGKPLNDRGLAVRLRQYGIKPKPIRTGENIHTLRGYTREDFHDAWQIYLPPPKESETSKTEGEKPSNFNADSVSDEQKPSEIGVNVSEPGEGGVSDQGADVSHDVTDKGEKLANKISLVSHVSLAAACGEGRSVTDIEAVMAERAERGEPVIPLCGFCAEPIRPRDYTLELVIKSTATGADEPIHDQCFDLWRNLPR